MNPIRDLLALTRLQGISQAMSTALIREFGSVDHIRENLHTLSPKIQQAFGNWENAVARAEKEMEFCEQKNIRILTLDSQDYPIRLNECDDPPLVLFYKGNHSLNEKQVISVVGTRHITEYGKDICHNFISEIKNLLPDCVIVSGLAYGVDIHAHRACISSGLSTIGVLAHGLDRIYPSLHRATAIEMLNEGGLLSEYMSETNPDKGNFVRRNRIVAGMSDATIVVESAAKGGALITARLANDYNREVFAFPGRIGDPYSAGCLKLIKTHCAKLITCAHDLAENMGWNVKTTQPPAQRELFPELTEEEEYIRKILENTDGLPINQIVVKSNLAYKEVSSALFELEMKGIVKAMAGGTFRLL